MPEQTKELQWGETPFDHMAPDEVLLNAKRMYSALVALTSVAKMTRSYDRGTYWKEGNGGKAIEKGEQALVAIDTGYTEREPAFRTFYRYADDLLFDTSRHPLLGMGWRICEKDGTMLGAHRDGSHINACMECEGPMRPIRWSDLAPHR